MRHSTPVATFGKGPDRIEIRQIKGGGTSATGTADTAGTATAGGDR